MINNKGFSILEVLVAAAISLMVFLGFASMSSQMNKELKHSSQRTDALEFRSSVSGLLANLNTCSCQLNQYLAPFDDSNPNAVANLALLKTSCDSAAVAFATPEQVVTGSNNRLFLNKMRLVNIESLGIPEKYRGRLSFDYQTENLLRAIPGFDLEVKFTTDPLSPSNAKVVTSCDFVSGTGGAGGTSSVSGLCPGGQYVTGISEGNVLCSAVVVSGAPSTDTAAGFSLTNPGPGCSGHNCITSDFGPCHGHTCRTNGLSCTEHDCIACAVGASCSGNGCCAGPSCRGCQIFNQ